MMCPAIDNPTSCEICSVICFLQAKNLSAVEIYCELWVVYGQNVMSEGTVRQWCRLSKNGWINVHHEQQSGRPPAVSDDLVQIVDQKTVKDGASQFQNFHMNFHKFHALLSTRLSHAKLSLRLALSKGPNWVDVFSPTFTWGRKQIQFLKHCVL
jgi:hypothetical protein